jgi:hypothetical protein
MEAVVRDRGERDGGDNVEGGGEGVNDTSGGERPRVAWPGERARSGVRSHDKGIVPFRCTRLRKRSRLH